MGDVSTLEVKQDKGKGEALTKPSARESPQTTELKQNTTMSKRKTLISQKTLGSKKLRVANSSAVKKIQYYEDLSNE